MLSKCSDFDIIKDSNTACPHAYYSGKSDYDTVQSALNGALSDAASVFLAICRIVHVHVPALICPKRSPVIRLVMFSPLGDHLRQIGLYCNNSSPNSVATAPPNTCTVVTITPLIQQDTVTP
jgi:hypothetical protein